MDKLTWVAEQVSKHLDEVDNTCTPCAEVDASSLTFEHVRYRCVQVIYIYIYICIYMYIYVYVYIYIRIHVRNPGKVFVHLRFVDAFTF